MTEYIQPDDVLNIYYRVSNDTITDIVTVKDEENDDVTSKLDNFNNVQKIQWSPDENEHNGETFTFDIDGFGTKEIKVVDIPYTEGGDDVEESIEIEGVEYRRHVFKSDGTFYIDDDFTVDILIVGGGGGGGFGNNSGSHGSGGGGAGGVVFAEQYQLQEGEYNVDIGEGGNTGNAPDRGENGEDSSFDDLIALGGGGGAARNGDEQGGDGGSGGGSHENEGGLAIQLDTNDNAMDYGNDGGDSIRTDLDSGDVSGSGGGGAGSPGEDANSYDEGFPHHGGDGLDFSSEFGTDVGENGWFGGGGAGSPDSIESIPASDGGKGGGGDSGASDGSNKNGEDGIDGTGGGGGGGVIDAERGGDGGDGIVIIRIGPL